MTVLINDYKIQNDMLFYQYNQKIISYLCFRLKFSPNFANFPNILHQSRIKIIYLLKFNPYSIFIFFKIKGKNMNKVHQKKEIVLNFVRENQKEQIYFPIITKDLEKTFFFFIKNFKNSTSSYKMIQSKSNLYLVNSKIQQKIYFFKNIITDLILYAKYIKYIENIIQNFNIESNIIMEFTPNNKFIVSLIFITHSLESYQNYLIDVQNQEIGETVHEKCFFLSDFKNLIKKKKLAYSKVFKIEQVTNFFNILDLFYNKEKITNNSDNLLKNDNIGYSIRNYFDSKNIIYFNQDNENILFNLSETSSIIHIYKNVKTLSLFFNKNYEKFNLIFIFFENIDLLKNILSNTSILKMKKLKIFQKNDFLKFFKYIEELTF